MRKRNGAQRRTAGRMPRATSSAAEGVVIEGEVIRVEEPAAELPRKPGAPWSGIFEIPDIVIACRSRLSDAGRRRIIIEE